MARQEKSTRARGLPPRVLLSQRQDATGSFPTVWRTSSDNRTGRYNVSFNDNKVVPFNQYEAADYDVDFVARAAADVAAGVQYVEKLELVNVASGSFQTIIFDTPFAGKPIVVISEINSSNNSHNVNAFLTGSINPVKFTVQFSSEFTGSIIYRAVYDPSPGTLRFVERKPRHPDAFVRLVAKGDWLLNTNTTDITFNDFGSDTAENYVTFQDTSTNGQADIWPNITTQTRTLVALTASSIASVALHFERFHGLHNKGIIYPVCMNQATILAGLSKENQIEMYGSVTIVSGAVANQPTKWIVASGSMNKNVADTFITFTPGQDIQAFKDSDSKVSGNPFYATGSAVGVTGQGFQQPLWSKNKIEFDITPAAEQTFKIHKSASAGSYPMGYWNPNTKLYEGIGGGKGIDSYAGTVDGLKQFLNEQVFGFAGSLDIGNAASNEQGLTYGRQISSFGFPYAQKFQTTSSQHIMLSDYISEPFLVEKIVVEINALIRHNAATTAAMWTFFLLNTRTTLPGQQVGLQDIVPIVSNTIGATFQTSSISSATYMDLIDHMHVVMTGRIGGGYILRELNLKGSGDSYEGQMTIPSLVKNSLGYTIIPTNFSGSHLDKAVFVPTLRLSGRNSIYESNGRDWTNAFEKPYIITSSLGNSYLAPPTLYTDINSAYTKPNPYILLPTDKITFGFQLPWQIFGSTDPTQFTEFKSHTTGINRITLYGSSLRVNPETNQLEEHHDTLNQLLSSESIHEVITG